MIAFFKLILYVPIYNVLIFITSYIPHSDVGLGIIGVTFLVRLVIFPLSLSAVRTQRAMQAINPEIKALQSKYKDDKETMALYKKYGVRPFASILTVFIQLPILISLYFMVRHESLTTVDTALLYPFIHAPSGLSPLFLGLLLISAPNLILAVLAAASQFAQAYFAFPIPPKQLKGASTEGMQAEFGRAMALQMRFVYPIVYGVIGYTSGAIALYFITGNIFTILQELYVRATPKKTQSTAAAVS
jgi:YidC/Oxa1 family membrane protein insertase